MTLTTLLLFASVFGVACAVPGPTVAALIARVLGSGTRGIVWFCAGLVTGDLIWLAMAVLGLAAIAALFQPVFLALKYLGVAYLLYLAWKLWTSPPVLAADAKPPRGEGLRLFAAAIAVVSGNPKTLLFYVALLPSVVPLAQVTLLGFVEMAAAVILVYGAILVVYVLAAQRVRRALRNTRAVRYANRAAAAVMTGAAAAIASRS